MKAGGIKMGGGKKTKLSSTFEKGIATAKGRGMKRSGGKKR